MTAHRKTRAMATRERGITRPMRRLGGIRHADFRRDDDTYLRSNPETVRQIEEAMRELDEGRGRPVTLDEIRAMLGLAE